MSPRSRRHPPIERFRYRDDAAAVVPFAASTARRVLVAGFLEGDIPRRLPDSRIPLWWRSFRFQGSNAWGMSNGLGAGFAGLTLLAVLLGLAGLLASCLAGVFVSRRRTGSVPGRLRSVSAALLGGVIVVAGFGVVALYDEALPLAVLFAVIVLLPLAAVGGYLRRTTDLTPIDILATAGVAWSLPFVVGVGVTFGLTTGLGSALEVPPAGARRRALVWIGTTVGGLVVGAGSMLVGRSVSTTLSAGRSP